VTFQDPINENLGQNNGDPEEEEDIAFDHQGNFQGSQENLDNPMIGSGVRSLESDMNINN